MGATSFVLCLDTSGLSAFSVGLAYQKQIIWMVGPMQMVDAASPCIVQTALPLYVHSLKHLMLAEHFVLPHMHMRMVLRLELLALTNSASLQSPPKSLAMQKRTANERRLQTSMSIRALVAVFVDVVMAGALYLVTILHVAFLVKD